MTPYQQEAFKHRLSAYLLPACLGVLAYLAQQNYVAVTIQLQRIEERQQAATVTLAELKLRILALETAISGHGPQPRGLPAAPL